MSASDIECERATLFSDDDVTALSSHLDNGSKSDQACCALLRTALLQTHTRERGNVFTAFLLTDKDEKRDRLLTKPLADQRADFLALAQRAQDRCFDLTAELKALTLVDASAALYRLAGAVLQRYTEAKAASGALDFDDLIQKTASLLSTSLSAEWVLYKLDGGLDHILVDEAQDTSPDQWEIIEALAREFFTGAGARDQTRTIFAVGDEKQSIYSFQGAEPAQFAKVGRRVETMTTDAAAKWRRVPLNMSFRTVQPVLDAVDHVFADAARTPGLTADSQTIEHIAKRFGQSGRLEIWPTEKPGDARPSSPWQPLDDATERAPANDLANRIAATIDDWLATGERLASEDRPIRAGDILILVRKRNPFAIPMVAALKARGIPVAGSDRMSLTDQIAVQDLLALGDFLTLPEDDLALAAVLKSPLFGFDDDDLLDIAPARSGALWKAFLATADQRPAWRIAAETLKRWRAKADFTPPFEFYSALLDRDGGRAKFLHRLGPESADAIDEFLDLALAYDDQDPPSLTGFLANLRSADREVKRDTDHVRDEVRIMTVHGAKGLEAPIVFLPDTCTTKSGDGPGTKLLKLTHVPRPSNLPAPVIWQIKGSARNAHVIAANAVKNARDDEERHRLLYVAMTRARDRLYICGFEGTRGRAKACWYDLISDSLSERCQQITGPDGRLLRRLESAQIAETEKAAASHATAIAAQPLPPFAKRRVAAEPQLAVPLAPSRLEPYAHDSDGEPLVTTPHPTDPGAEPSLPALSAGLATDRFLRGNITHALLQYLPDLPEGERKSAATAFVAIRAPNIPSKTRLEIVRETLAILHDENFAALFAPGSRAEVPISAILPRTAGRGPALRLTGQIDRLVVTPNEVMIVDYKTNRLTPPDAASVAPAYLYQLAAYGLALDEIYPGRRLRAALLWTNGPRLMEIPPPILRDYGARLWQLEIAELAAGVDKSSLNAEP